MIILITAACCMAPRRASYGFRLFRGERRVSSLLFIYASYHITIGLADIYARSIYFLRRFASYYCLLATLSF